MRNKKYYTLIILIMIPYISLFSLVNSFASEYPRDRFEREYERTGSLLGGDGVTFKPKVVQSTKTVAKIGNVNKYLYYASIHKLRLIPLLVSNAKTGSIITEWHKIDNKPGIQFKINIQITGDQIKPEALEVIVLKRIKKGNQWSKDHTTSSMSARFEDQILRKARELYLDSVK